MPDLGTAVIGGTTLLGGFLQKEGADEQSEAIEKAAQSTENWQKYLVNLEERKYDEAERFRNLAFNEAKMKVGAMRTAMPLLKQYATSEPGTSPQYQTALRRGTQ